MSVLERMKSKDKNGGWLGETLERAARQREQEQVETQRKRLENQAMQANDPNFIGAAPKWYADAVNQASVPEISPQNVPWIKGSYGKSAEKEKPAEVGLLGGDSAKFQAPPKRSLWGKFTDTYKKSLEAMEDYYFGDVGKRGVFSGTELERLHDKLTGYKDNKSAYSTEQYADLGRLALSGADRAGIEFQPIPQALERLKNSPEYKDSVLVEDLAEAEKSWANKPLTALTANVIAAVGGMGGDIASALNAVGIGKIPGIRNATNGIVSSANQLKNWAARYNKGTEGELLGNVTQGVVSTTPYLALALASGGASAPALAGSGAAGTAALQAKNLPIYTKMAKTFIKNPAFWYSLSSMFGQKYQQAIDSGASELEAQLNATLYAIPSALIEVSGGFGSPQQTTQKMGETIVDEVKEELLQDFFGGASDKLTTNRNLPLFSTTEDAVINPVNMANTALTTGIVTALAGGGGRLAQKGADVLYSKYGGKPQTDIDPRMEVYNSDRPSNTVVDANNFNTTEPNIASDMHSMETSAEQIGKWIGRATTIKNPYTGNVPDVVGNIPYVVPEVSKDSIDRAKAIVSGAVNAENNTISRKEIKSAYEQAFLDTGGQIQSTVKNLLFEDEPYVVTVYKTAIGKVISDKNLSVQKLAVLDNLQPIIENAEYVGSGEYVPKTSKQKDTVRFDYFETPVKIAGDDYIVTFDVEVFPNSNNYRTHKVINKMDLIPATNADVGPVPTANVAKSVTDPGPVPGAADSESSPSNYYIPQSEENVNTNAENTAQPMQQPQEAVNAENANADLQQAKERIAHYSEKTGRKVVWYNEKTNPELADTNGLMKDGVIYINENAQNPYMEVFKHELFHSLPAEAKKAVIDFFRTHVNENTPAFRKFKAQEMQRQRQKNLKYSDADFWEEYAAQNAEFLLDEGYIEQIAKTDRNLAQRILDAIKQLLERMKDVFAPDRYNYTEAVNSHESGKVSGMNDTQLRKAQRLYEKVLYGVNENADGETKYSFAGEKAKTANRSLLKQAEQMAEQGASKEEILQKTGWFTGLDGQWRYELDDSKMQIAADRMKEKYDAWLEEDIRRWQKDDPNLSREEATAAIQQAEQMPLTLGEMLDYPELFAAYPELQDVNVWMMDEDSENSAEYNPDSNTILLYRDGIRNAKRSLIHEIQHIIQGIEGFAPGAPQGATGDAYRNNAGEIEARTAADRRNMTAEQRRNSLALQDEKNVVFAEKDGATKYEIKTLPDGKRYVQADRQVIYSDNPDDWGQEITDYINQKIRNGEDVGIPTDDGDILKITGDTAWKLSDRTDLSDTAYAVKRNMATHIDELAQISQFDKNKPDMNQKHTGKRFSPDSFDYRTAFFRDFDGSYYQLNLSVGVDKNGKTVYSIGKNPKKRRFPKVIGSSSERGALLSRKPSITDSIPPKGEPVNTSIRDIDGEDTKFSMKQSQFYDSLQEADTVADEVKQGVQEQEDAFKYTPVANEQTMKQASERIQADPQKAAVRFMGTDSQHATADDVATGFLLMKQYQDNGDFESAVEVAKKLSTLGTEAGRKVQIYSILERLTPEGMLKYATGELEKVKKLVAKEKGQLWMNEHGKQFDLTSDEAKWITDTMTRVQTMPDGRDRAVLIGEIQKMLQDKMPSTVGEKVAALQRISLLLNPKTVLSRNAVSNLLMNPVYVVNDFIASGIDKAVSKKTGVRTIAAPSYKQQWQGAKKGAYESFDDFRRGINTRDVEADNFRIGQGTPFKGKNKLSKALAKLDKLVSFALDAGDRPFYEGYFLESLNGQMKANHVAKPTADMIDIARQTALEKTWQDSNAVTRSANQIRNALNFGKKFGLGSIVAPFVKTPSNIAKAIVEYSPAGLAKGLVVDGNRLLKAVKNGTATPQMQYKFCNNVAKGMTGTIMYIIGLVLAAKGVTTGSDDEKDKDVRNFKRNVQGIMQNSIKVGDRTFSYDWAQPIGGILTTAADIKNNTYSTDNMINTLTQAMTAGGNTLFEQSMLKGLSDFFGEYDGFMSSVARALAEAPTQFIPTALKQVAEVVDPVARSTKGDGILDTAKNKAMARIPGATKKLEPVVDVLGRDVMRYGGKNNLFNIFLNPANVNISNPTPATTEVWRLYEQTGNTDVFPKVAPSSFTDDGVKYQMTPKEQTQFQRTMGQEADKQITALLNSPKYKNADDEKKAEMMEDAVEKSFDKAKKELIENRGEKPSKRLQKAVK